MYKIKIKRENELVSSNWTGGTTTQLAIYPEASDYSKRDFLWRLSSATVECEESIFTQLAGINRIIMTIDGDLTLKHNNKTVVLKPFEPYSFAGDLETKSFGKVKDFNLMFTDSCQGKVEVLEITDNTLKDITINADEDDFQNKTVAFYCATGKIEVNFMSREPLTLNQGDIMLITLNNEPEKVNMILRNFMLKNSVLVRAEIKY